MVDNSPGSLFIVAAPSGGGKTSLVKYLISNLDKIEVSVSHTTRPIRTKEKNGKDYFFISEKEFKSMIKQDAFIEYAQVFNYFYGTSKAQIKQRLQAGIDVVLDIDWQGAQQIKQKFTNAVSIFIIPPSLASLKERLLARQRDDEKIIDDRMQCAQDELQHFKEFDYLIVNDKFPIACQELQAIVINNRLSIKRQSIQQKNLLSFLLAKQ